MKFMKLGSKPDAFQGDGKCIRYVNSDLETDVIINVDQVKFYLHKFPLMSKSNSVLRLVAKAREEDSDEINLVDFPGGPKAFEICAKFCYGMTVTLNAYNVVAARCAAEYLEMTEDVEHGNLIFKIEVFLSSCILRGWKDSIIVLQTTELLLPWSEDLKIVGRCVDSIASKTSLDLGNVYWPYTYSRKSSMADKIIEDGMALHREINAVPRDWWVEDICELEIDLFKRVMTAIKSKGRMDGATIVGALETYAVRWLTEYASLYVSDAHRRSNKSLVEAIICLLPPEKEDGCSCSFLLKVLKVGILVGLDDSSQRYLVKRIGLQLHEASVKDLLIPARSPQTTLHDSELVKRFVDEFMAHERYCHNLDIEKNGWGEEVCGRRHESLLAVGRLIDGVLAEIACDPNMEVSCFVLLAVSLPNAARPVHDGLYKAIDIYLKEHPSLAKAERKKLCGLMDVKKLTANASTHAAQNERLPLRLVVQVLFFAQLRAAAQVQAINSCPRDGPDAGANAEPEKTPAEDHYCLKKQISERKTKDGELHQKGKLIKTSSNNSGSGIRLLPSRSRRMFEKLFNPNKGNSASRSSETSGSSQSPTCLAPRDGYKSSAPCSRQRRHSVS